MVVADKGEDGGPLDVKGDVAVVGQLIKKVAGIGVVITTSSVIGASHVSTRPDAQMVPAIPHPKCVYSDRNKRRVQLVRRLL
jgi:hypothetical protein